jgi:hypothetical protein
MNRARHPLWTDFHEKTNYDIVVIFYPVRRERFNV